MRAGRSKGLHFEDTNFILFTFHNLLPLLSRLRRSSCSCDKFSIQMAESFPPCHGHSSHPVAHSRCTKIQFVMRRDVTSIFNRSDLMCSFLLKSQIGHRPRCHNWRSDLLFLQSQSYVHLFVLQSPHVFALLAFQMTIACSCSCFRTFAL
jgi:hypothetical protein